MIDIEKETIKQNNTETSQLGASGVCFCQHKSWGTVLLGGAAGKHMVCLAAGELSPWKLLIKCTILFQNEHPGLKLVSNVFFITIWLFTVVKNYEDISHISQGKDISYLHSYRQTIMISNSFNEKDFKSSVIIISYLIRSFIAEN